MGTSDIAGKARRFDRWLGAQLDGLLRRKDRLETAYCERVDVFRPVLAAGVGRVAHADPTDRKIDREAALEFVADHREKLSDPATAPFERLHDGEALGRFLEAL